VSGRWQALREGNPRQGGQRRNKQRAKEGTAPSPRTTLRRLLWRPHSP